MAEKQEQSRRDELIKTMEAKENDFANQLSMGEGLNISDEFLSIGAWTVWSHDLKDDGDGKIPRPLA